MSWCSAPLHSVADKRCSTVGLTPWAAGQEQGPESPLGSDGFDQSSRAHYIFPHSTLWYFSDASPLSYHYNAVCSTQAFWSSLVSNVLWLRGDGGTFASVALLIFPAQPHFGALHPRQRRTQIDSGRRGGVVKRYAVYLFFWLFPSCSLPILGLIICLDVLLLTWWVTKQFGETLARWQKNNNQPKKQTKTKNNRGLRQACILDIISAIRLYKGLDEIVWKL